MKLKLNETTGEVTDTDGTTFCYIAKSGFANAAFIVRACNAHDELAAYAECEEAHRAGLAPTTNGGTGNSQSYFETFTRHGWDGRDLYGFLDKMRRAALARAKGEA